MGAVVLDPLNATTSVLLAAGVRMMVALTLPSPEAGVVSMSPNLPPVAVEGAWLVSLDFRSVDCRDVLCREADKLEDLVIAAHCIGLACLENPT
jgi:hypothetical protein